MYWGQLPKGGGGTWTVCDLGGGALQERGECRF